MDAREELLEIIGYSAEVSLPNEQPITAFYTDRHLSPILDKLVEYVTRVRADEAERTLEFCCTDTEPDIRRAVAEDIAQAIEAKAAHHDARAEKPWHNPAMRDGHDSAAHWLESAAAIARRIGGVS